MEASSKENVVGPVVLEPLNNLTLSRTRSFTSPTSLIVRFRLELELTSIGCTGDVTVLERPRGREGEVVGDRTFSLSDFRPDFEGVECSLGWTFSLSGATFPFSMCRTSGEANAWDDESSGVEPAEGLGVIVSSSPLDEGEGRSFNLLSGGASRATRGFVAEIGLMFVEAAEAAERRLFSAVAKVSSVPFELDIDPTEDAVAEEGLEASIRDRTDRTEFLF